MQALYFDGSRVRVIERPEPQAGPDSAVVRMRLAGVCNTDLEIARGYMDFRGVLGHEGVGEVVEGPPEWLGRRVVSEINFACGHCATCRSGLGRHCPSRRVMGILAADGAFAQYLAVPVANLHAVPDAMGDDRAVFAEPLAAAFEILEQVGEVAGQHAVVFGDGKLGLLIAQVLDNAGAQVLAVGHHRSHLALLSQRGIETCAAASFPPGNTPRADLVVEATGSPEGLAGAIAAVRPRGTLVLKTTLAEHPRVDLARIVIDEIHLVGSRCGPFTPALAALETGSVDVSALVEERFPLSQSVEALERAAARGARKVVIDCEGSS
ncbi:MAG: alcohol dehydrogenase catalytic domain-containing protein [Myxococcota bacterium]|nr:alcohol dehydrogenase catalytic domain-containing protein [Myxococcota bacterium]